MPELPEVETIRSGLQEKIVGLKIKQVEVLSPGKFFGNPKILDGKIVLKVWRRAKILGIDLAGNHKGPVGSPSPVVALLFHLKMTGQLILIPGNKGRKASDQRLIGGHPTEDMVGPMPNKYTRAIFEFENGAKLYFNDLRKFGWIRVVESEELKVMNEAGGMFALLGPEPLDQGFNLEDFTQRLLRRKNSTIKEVILDQRVVAGVGNIYACEALFHAKVDPRRKVSELSDPEIKGVFEGIIFALSEGVAAGGSTRQHFVNIDGYRGYFLDNACVYGREGDICRVCGGRISKIKVGARGTFFCPQCQK